jgi:hypothetical protein
MPSELIKRKTVAPTFGNKKASLMIYELPLGSSSLVLKNTANSWLNSTVIPSYKIQDAQQLSLSPYHLFLLQLKMAASHCGS